MLKIKLNDKVIILNGKDKKKIGIVRKIIKKKFVFVEGLNLYKKHTKPIPNKNKTGGIVKIEKPLNISNIALFNYSNKKIDKIKFKFIKNKKVRILKSNGEVLN